MIRKYFLLILTFVSILLFSDDNIGDYSKSIHYLLDEVNVFYQDDNVRFRYLIFRGGYDNVSAHIVIQKFEVDHDGQNIPYELINSVEFSEINKVYNFDIKSITKNDYNFTITLDAVHSYIHDETEIEIKLLENMEYEIISGLVKL